MLFKEASQALVSLVYPSIPLILVMVRTLASRLKGSDVTWGLLLDSWRVQLAGMPVTCDEHLFKKEVILKHQTDL